MLAARDVANEVGSAEPTDDLERAWLILAGRRDLAAELPIGTPPSVNGESIEATHQREVVRRATERGYVPLVAVSELDRLTVTPARE